MRKVPKHTQPDEPAASMLQSFPDSRITYEKERLKPIKQKKLKSEPCHRSSM
jgi:hypothetical protein